MTSPGSIPGLPRLPGQANPVSSQSPPNAQVISVPEKLQDIRDVLLVRGTVSESKPDGTIKVETPQGTIELKIAPQARPPEGQAVEIEIQPGRPPQTARVEADDPEPKQTPRPSQTPVDVTVQRPERPAPPERYSPDQPQDKEISIPRSLPPELAVRLEPVSQAQALEAIADPLEIISYVLKESLVLKTEIISNAIATDAALISAPVKNILPTQKTETPPATLIKISAAAAEIIPRLLMENTGFSTKLPGVTDIRNPQLFAAPDTQAKPAQPVSIIFESVSKLRAGAVPIPGTLPDFSILNDVLPVPGIKDNAKTGLAAIDFLHPVELQSLSVSGITASFAKTPIAAIPIKAETFNATVIKSADFSVRLVPAKGETALEFRSLVAQPSPLIGSNQNPATITGTVIGQTAQSLPVIHFFTQESGAQSPGLLPADLFFVVHSPANLTPGAEITFTPQNAGPVVAATLPSLGTAAPFATAVPWPLLNEILEVLTQASPMAARAFSNILPAPANAAQITPAALFFFAALRGGDMSQWLGERAADILRRDSRNLLSRLNAEGSTLNRMMNDSVTQDWRGLHIPLYWEGQTHKLSLHYKHEFHDEKDGKDGGKQVRFIFDLALDQMGKVQLDGLFRGKKLDLIIRTQQAFSPAMQNRMRAAYINALTPTEIRGELSFQNKIEQWVTITAGTKQKFGTSA